MAGNYTVNLTATNGNGINSTTSIITVSEKPSRILPVANFTSNVTSGIMPLTISFNDTSTGVPISWYWDFGDGKNSTAKSPIHTYSTTGTYTVALTATNAAGNNTTIKSNYIVYPLQIVW